MGDLCHYLTNFNLSILTLRSPANVMIKGWHDRKFIVS